MKNLAVILLAAAAVIAGGCVSSAPPAEFVGNYTSPDISWFLKMDKEGNIEFSFFDPPVGGSRMVARGYCDFNVDDPHRPMVFPQLDQMRGRFQLVWSPDGSRLAVVLLLSDKNELVMRHGHQVILYREKTAPAN